MPTVIVATAGATTANSYVTEAEADVYFDGRINADPWRNSIDHVEALVTATREIDRLHFLGERASATQALRWPREGLVDEEGEQVPSDVVPEFVKRATFERALQIVAAPTLASASGLDAIESITKGPFTLKPRHRKIGMNDATMDYLRRYLAPQNRLRMG